MKDEIKEILEWLEFRKNYGAEIDEDDLTALLDYITNLQDKIKQYEDPEDLTLFHMWLDEKAKDKMKQLQEEKERLKEIHDSILFQIDIHGKNVFVQEEIDLYNYIKDLEKIIEEAKEYCKSHFKCMVADEEAERLLDILNKTNKEERI